MSLAQYRITVGHCATHSLSKEYDTSADGRLIKRAGGDRNYFHWSFEAHEIADDEALVALIRSIQPDPHACLINGLTAPWIEPGGVYRKLAALEHAADKRTILDGFVRHVVLDFDDIPAEGLGRGDQFREAAALIDQELPTGVAGRRKVVVRSPSSGMNPDAIRMRMIVPFKKAASLADLTVWQKGAAAGGFPNDPSQGRLGQIAYTAAPVIFGGGVDPIAPADSVFVLNPDADVADLDVHAFDELALQVDARQRVVLNEALARGWRHAAEQLIGEVVKTDSASRFFEPISAVLGLAARSGEDADTIANYLLPLIKKRVKAFDPKDVGGRLAYYDRAFIHRHLASFLRRDEQTSRSIAAARSKIFA